METDKRFNTGMDHFYQIKIKVKYSPYPTLFLASCQHTPVSTFVIGGHMSRVFIVQINGIRLLLTAATNI